MGIEIIKSKFPFLSREDESFIERKIGDKCSHYYFLDFMMTTSGNVSDAYELFKLDEQLRSILFRYLIRFEIQIKCDFVDFIAGATGSAKFWSNKSFYMFVDDKKFDDFKNNILESFKNLNVSPNKANSYAAVHVMSFGTFIKMFKNINPMYKRIFISKYTSYLPVHSFDILLKYLYCLRALRNRCAHGTQIVSMSFANQLGQFSFIKKSENIPNGCHSFSVFELTLYYLFNMLNCGEEAKKEIKNLLLVYEGIFSRYGSKQILNPSIIKKLF